MKLTIRKSVFETNSSSTHAICIAKKNIENYPESLTFKIGHFGWEKAYYCFPEEKASYLYSALAEYYLYDDGAGKKNFVNKIEEINKILNKKGIDCTFEHLDDLYKDGYEALWRFDGGIDHVYELADFIEDVTNTESKLLRYLFSYDSIVITGNDNGENTYVDEHTVNSYVNNPVEVYYKGN